MLTLGVDYERGSQYHCQHTPFVCQVLAVRMSISTWGNPPWMLPRSSNAVQRKCSLHCRQNPTSCAVHEQEACGDGPVDDVAEDGAQGDS